MAKKENEQSQNPQPVKLNIGGKVINATMNDEGVLEISESEREVVADALDVIRQAQGMVDGEMPMTAGSDGAVTAEGAGNTPVTAEASNNTADKMRGLPMRELIGAPLFAAAEAQQKLAAISLDYFNRIAFTERKDSNGKPVQGDPETRILKFKVKRPVEVNGQMEQMEQTVEAPFIGLVPIPSLLIDKIDVDFQMEVTDTNTTKAESSAELKSSASAKWFTVQAEMSAKVAASRETTRSSNQAAKYQVHVTATQQPRTEGLSKLMDIMASCIEPIPVK